MIEIRKIILMFCVLFVAGCANNYSGFITPNDDVLPISQSYDKEMPALSIKNPKDATIIVYMHGTTRSQRPENCGFGYNDVPESFRRLEDELSQTYIYYLCSKATDGGVRGSYISKRVVEVNNLLDELILLGVKQQNIFLAGQSAGGWTALMAMKEVGNKFNAALVTAPACCGKRSESTRYPEWRKYVRPRQIGEMLAAEVIRALVFAYPDDAYNRPQELKFLTDKYPDSVQIVIYGCGEGHSTHRKDCRLEETVQTMKSYILAKKEDFLNFSKELGY